jgi:lysophospholipase L1-like esterase
MKYLNKIIVLLLLSSFINADTVRIMPLGDSITYDNSYADLDNPRPTSQRSGYRNYLWYNLQDANYNANFVGSQRAGEAIRPSFDADNEGHAGWTSYQLAEHTFDWVSKYKPNIVLLHAGSNDWKESSQGVEDILNEIDLYENISGNSVTVILALIINRKKPVQWVRDLNKNIKNMAQKRINRGDNIVIIDMEHDAGINYGGDFQDAVHPNNTGYRKMANLWYKAITNISLIERDTLSVTYRFYNLILARNPSNDELNIWKDYLEKYTVASMTMEFFSGDEYKKRYLSDEAFLNILYGSLFRRNPDKEGFEYWLSELDKHNIKREEIIEILLLSKEFVDICKSEGLKAITENDKTILKSFKW